MNYETALSLWAGIAISVITITTFHQLTPLILNVTMYGSTQKHCHNDNMINIILQTNY